MTLLARTLFLLFLICVPSFAHAAEQSSEPSDPVISAFAANKANVVLGEPVVLSWKANNVDRCESGAEWGHGISKELVGSETVAPIKRTWYSSDGTSQAQTSYFYNLSCYAKEKRVSKTITVKVDPAKSFLSFSSSSKSIKQGDIVTLTWSSNSADRCVAGDAWSGEKSVGGGTETFMPESTTRYSLECFSGTASAKKEVLVSVSPRKAPVINYFKVSKQVVSALQPARLSWSANASTCIARDSWSGVQVLHGSQDVTPAGPLTTYTLECSRDGLSVTRSVQVTVVDGPKNMTISANKTSIRDGEPVILSWHAEQADSCDGWGSDWSKKSLSFDGTAVVHPTFWQGSPASTYTLRCTRAGATLERSVSLDVQAHPFLVFSSSDQSVDSGKQVTFSWDAGTAERCSASGGWSGEKQVTGVEMIVVQKSETYSIECFSRGASAKKSVFVGTTYIPGAQQLPVSFSQPTLLQPQSPPQIPPFVLWGPGRQPSSGPMQLSQCRRTGCSGEVCADRDVITSCLSLPEHACYQYSRCERLSNGSCGWVETGEYKQCRTQKTQNTPPSSPIFSSTPGQKLHAPPAKKQPPKNTVQKKKVQKKPVLKKTKKKPHAVDL